MLLFAEGADSVGRSHINRYSLLTAQVSHPTRLDDMILETIVHLSGWAVLNSLRCAN